MIDRSVPIPRDTLAWFVGEMERELRKNDHKPGWDGDRTLDLHDRLVQESDELREVIATARLTDASDFLKIISEAADVANFAMMVADKAQRQIDKLIEDARTA